MKNHVFLNTKSIFFAIHFRSCRLPIFYRTYYHYYALSNISSALIPLKFHFHRNKFVFLYLLDQHYNGKWTVGKNIWKIYSVFLNFKIWIRLYSTSSQTITETIILIKSNTVHGFARLNNTSTIFELLKFIDIAFYIIVKILIPRVQLIYSFYYKSYIQPKELHFNDVILILTFWKVYGWIITMRIFVELKLN